MTFTKYVCPRCGGRLYLDTYGDTNELSCILCGRSYRLEVIREASSKKDPAASR